MAEATWGEGTRNAAIDWSMSAALRNVVRGNTDVAEVTNLAEAVRAWTALDADHQASAVLTPEHPVVLDGASHATLTGETIATLSERLPD